LNLITQYFTADGDDSQSNQIQSLSDIDEELAKYKQFLDKQTLKEVFGDSIYFDESEDSILAPGSKSVPLEVCGDDEALAALEDEELKAVMNLKKEQSLSLASQRPTVASLGLKTSIEECLQTPAGRCGWYQI
jgi:hypothetical protein